MRRVGKRCKVSSHTFICEGVTVEDNVFIGHGVVFINDSYPRATAADGNLQTEADWKVERTVVKKGASIGSGATILSNLSIGENAIVGAGSVVTKNVPPNSIVAGNPAKVLRYIEPDPGGHKVSVSHSSSDSIPFLDLVTPHVELEQELTAVFRKALRTAAFIGGPMVEEFREGVRRFLRCEAFGSHQQRNRRSAFRADGKRRETRRCGGHRAAYVHRDH